MMIKIRNNQLLVIASILFYANLILFNSPSDCLPQAGLPPIAAHRNPKPTIRPAENNVTTNIRPTGEPNAGAEHHQEQATQQMSLGGKCGLMASCSKQLSRPIELDQAANKLPCYCDEKCVIYDDCCQDSSHSESMARRQTMGWPRLKSIRSEWHCQRINPIFGDVLVKASCAPDWLTGPHQVDSQLAQTIKKKCDYVKDRGKLENVSSDDVNQEIERWLQADPIGGLMPITDLISGITYANSYCLRCNPPIKRQQQKLIYWSPLLDCNYNLDNDDRNNLYDLINAKKGQALQYSSKRNKWLINVPSSTTTTAATTSTTSQVHPSNLSEKSNNITGSSKSSVSSHSTERVCNITPTIPESVEHVIRYCRTNTIDTCPEAAAHQVSNSTAQDELKRAQFECKFGHQSLVYSQTSELVYYNLACAKCNHEKQIFCKSKLRKQLIYSHAATGGGGGFINGTANLPIDESNSGELQFGIGAGRSNGLGGIDTSGSFSVLMDLYGSGDGQVGQVHQCPVDKGQVFDSFFLTCRDVFCGLNQRYVEGRCVMVTGESHDNLHQLLAGNATLESSLSLFPNRTTLSEFELVSGNISSTTINANILSNNMTATSSQPTSLTSTPIAPIATTTASDNQDPADEPMDRLPVAVAEPNDAGEPDESSDHEDEEDRPMTTVVVVVGSSTTTTTTTITSTRRPAVEPATAAAAAAATIPTPTTSGHSSGRSVHQLGGVDLAQQQQPRERNETQTLSKLPSANHTDTDATPANLNGLPGELLGRDIQTLPMPSSESRRAFAQCGKILISPEHYKLFTIDKNNQLSEIVSGNPGTGGESFASQRQQQQQPQVATSTEQTNKTLTSTNDSSAASLLASKFKLNNRQQFNTNHHVWAYVSPYNLTLASSDFELIRSTTTTVQFKLLVCSPFKTDLVDKFKPAMAYLTVVCLVISIASLACYLLLYCLSTFDLRHLVVEIAQAGQAQEMLHHNPLSKFRGSRASTENGAAGQSSSPRGQSLSSRGVACLASALLAAYLLFIVGHKSQEQQQSESTDKQPQVNSCVMIAASTYFFFLLAFNWMLLLSYDIWRTLRLATCHLRAPAMHSQSVRFLIYCLVAILAALLVTMVALFVDQADPQSCPGVQKHTLTSTLPNNSSDTNQDQQGGCTDLDEMFDNFVQTYRPKFGQRAGSCWFSNRRSLALFFGLPVTSIMFINLLFFLHSSFMVIRTSSKSSRRLTKRNSNNSQQQQQQECSQSQQQADFTQQNSLTTSSMASVQTTMSNLSSSSSTSSQSSYSHEDDEPESRLKETKDGATIESNLNLARNLVETTNDTNRRLNQSRETGQQVGEGPARPAASPVRRKLMQTNSQSSLATNHSFGGVSIATSLVEKYDSQLAVLSSFMSSIVKDYRLYCRLSTIMGLTWLTGLMASMVDQSDVLWYLFVILNTLQGLFIFIAFGCKQSKLANLAILIDYLRFKTKLLVSGG